MSAENQKRGYWAFWIAFLLCISVTATSLFQTHKRNEAEAEVRKLTAQLQDVKSQLYSMDTEFFYDGDSTFFLLRKSRVNRQNSEPLGIKFVNPMSGAETALVLGSGAYSYYVFKVPKRIPWTFQVKVITKQKEELLKLFP